MAIQGGRAARAAPPSEPARGSVPATIAEPEALPKLGALPAVRHRRWRREVAELSSVFQGQAHLVDVIDKPKGGFAAAVAGIRRALARAGAGDERRRILVLGLEPQAGATTLALNLALDAARAGLPALLVDAGGGSRGLTAVFAAGAPIGLGDVIAGAVPLSRAILKDEGTGLTFLPRSGAALPAEADGFRAGRFAAAHRFGPMIVDGGSLSAWGLAGRFAEAADDIVLVLREDSLAKVAGESWRAQLGPHAEKLRGLVVNAA
jgi:hypothetical protein